MTCRELIEFLDAYESGELASEPRAEFNQHLSECPACVAYLKSYRETISLARASLQDSDDAAPDNVPQELLTAIRAALKKKG